MELVYLWVEEYKNIRNQGFNFSPRFEFDYDKSNNKLIKVRDESRTYKSIFPDNINITAIVGENGSGKSSVLNAILNASVDYFPKETNYILVFSDGKTEYYTSNFNLQTKISRCTNSDCKKSLVAYINRGNNDEDILIHGVSQYTPRSSARKAFIDYKEIDVSKETIVRFLTVEIGKIDSSFKLSSFMYVPNKISMQLKTKEELIGRFITTFTNDREKIEKEFLEIKDPVHHILFLEAAIYHKIRDIETLKNKEVLKKKLTENNSKYKTIDNDISSVLREKEFTISSLTELQKDTYLREKSYFDYLEFDLIDEQDRRYNDLSHGEQMLFGQLLNLYFYCTSNKDFIFLFDEPEIALHPRWQKNYVNELYNLLIKMEKNYHFIFTSHSPFLLSDLPKENVIFLEKDEANGNCKNVTSTTNIETFGANIHTLLSHGFFMSDGLMGEFAKGKINEAIKLLNQKTLTEKEIDFCENIISIIGEPILKRQLQKMIDSKRLLGIENINQKIKDMEYELEILKKHQKGFIQDEIKDRAKRKYHKKKKDDSSK